MVLNKTLLAFMLVLVLMAGQAANPDLYVNLVDHGLGLQAATNRTVLVTGNSLPRGVSGVVIQDKSRHTTDVDGGFWVSNAVPGVYFVDVIKPSFATYPAERTTFYVLVTNGTDVVYARENIVANPGNTYPPDSVSWGAAASDLRYVSRSEVTNLVADIGSGTVPEGTLTNNQSTAVSLLGAVTLGGTLTVTGAVASADTISSVGGISSASGNISAAGDVIAGGSFDGDGSLITGLNASQLSSGTVPSARGGAGTVSGLMKANGSGTVSAALAGTDYLTPTGNGSALTGVNAATATVATNLATTPPTATAILPSWVRTNMNEFIFEDYGTITYGASATRLEASANADAMQRAINAAGEAGGGIVRPGKPGLTYVITTNSLIQPYVTKMCLYVHGPNIIFDGQNALFRAHAETGTVGANATSMFYLSNSLNTVFRSMRVDGNRDNRGAAAGTECEGFHIYANWTNVLMRDITVYSMPEDGVDAHVGYGAFLADNIIAYSNNAEGISFSNNNGNSRGRILNSICWQNGFGDVAYPSAGINMYNDTIVDNCVVYSNRIGVRAISVDGGALSNTKIISHGNNVGLSHEFGNLYANNVQFIAYGSTPTNAIIDSGGVSHFLNCTISGGYGVLVGRAADFKWSGGSGITVSSGYGIAVSNILSRWTIDNVPLIRNASGVGVRTIQANTAGNGKLSNLRFEYTGASMFNDTFGNTNIVIDNCDFTAGAGANNIYLEGAGGLWELNNSRVSGNLNFVSGNTRSKITNNRIFGNVNFTSGSCLSNLFTGNFIGGLTGNATAQAQQLWQGNYYFNYTPVP